jgi:hypothetical protein
MRWSLFRLYNEGEALTADDADGLARLGTRLAPRPPELAHHPHLSNRPARRRDLGAGSNQRFGARADAAAAREVNPEEGLSDLHDRRQSDDDESQRTLEDKKREENRADKEHRRDSPSYVRLRGLLRDCHSPAAGSQRRERHQAGGDQHTDAPPQAGDVVVPANGTVDREPTGARRGDGDRGRGDEQVEKARGERKPAAELGQSGSERIATSPAGAT